MYKHHEQSIENMKEHFRKQGAIALIFVGSVEKGMERADSDLDGVLQRSRCRHTGLKCNQILRIATREQSLVVFLCLKGSDSCGGAKRSLFQRLLKYPNTGQYYGRIARIK